MLFLSLFSQLMYHFPDPPQPDVWKHSLPLRVDHIMILHLLMWLADYKTVSSLREGTVYIAHPCGSST